MTVGTSRAAVEELAANLERFARIFALRRNVGFAVRLSDTGFTLRALRDELGQARAKAFEEAAQIAEVWADTSVPARLRAAAKEAK